LQIATGNIRQHQTKEICFSNAAVSLATHLGSSREHGLIFHLAQVDSSLEKNISV
jgi:hypothetical protein